jgi:hypothetical protein
MLDFFSNLARMKSKSDGKLQVEFDWDLAHTLIFDVQRDDFGHFLEHELIGAHGPEYDFRRIVSAHQSCFNNRFIDLFVFPHNFWPHFSVLSELRNKDCCRRGRLRD